VALIEGIHVQNYRALKDLTLGRTFENRSSKPLPRLIAFIGPNGCGKSSLMDALSFIGDCLQFGVEMACDMSHRGGFERLRTKGVNEPIKFEIYYRQEKNSRPISYSLNIDIGDDNRPIVVYERLRQRRKGQSRGWPYSFLEMTNGEGFAWAGMATENEEGSKKIEVKLEDKQRLGITTLGNLADHPRIVAFRQFLESWYLSYFVPDLARGMPMTGAQKHLNRKGDNLANYVQFMERQHSKRFDQVLDSISKKIPGIYKISHERQKDGRLLLQFNEKGYEDPFYQLDMSDGTLKMFAYLLLLEDPEPAPLIGIEEPENGLHHQLLEPLAREMRQYALKEKNGPQIVVTTHSPFFVDALTPDEVWILEKGNNGFSTAVLASEIPSIKELHSEGIPMGSLWYSNHFGRGNP
jgi:predicted ATPase